MNTRLFRYKLFKTIYAALMISGAGIIVCDIPLQMFDLPGAYDFPDFHSLYLLITKNQGYLIAEAPIYWLRTLLEAIFLVAGICLIMGWVIHLFHRALTEDPKISTPAQTLYVAKSGIDLFLTILRNPASRKILLPRIAGFIACLAVLITMGAESIPVVTGAAILGLVLLYKNEKHTFARRELLICLLTDRLPIAPDHYALGIRKRYLLSFINSLLLVSLILLLLTQFLMFF